MMHFFFAFRGDFPHFCRNNCGMLHFHRYLTFVGPWGSEWENEKWERREVSSLFWFWHLENWMIFADFHFSDRLGGFKVDFDTFLAHFGPRPPPLYTLKVIEGRVLDLITQNSWKLVFARYSEDREFTKCFVCSWGLNWLKTTLCTTSSVKAI